MGQELQIPDSFKGGMAQAFAAAGLNPEEDNLADGIGQSYGVIGYKGKTWTLRYRGEKYNIIDARTGALSPHLDVIVLGQAKVKSKSFYPKYQPGQSDGDRPLCSSIDGLTPDADVEQKQADHCAVCPRNTWKTDAQTGRKGRECTDYKRLAVLILPTQTAPILGSPLIEPVFLRVPPDSLNSLAIMGETMSRQGHHHASYVTRITFDPNKAHPAMVFKPLQKLTEKEAPVIIEARNNPQVARITGGDTAARHEMLPAGSNATGLTAPAAPPPPSSQGGTGSPSQGTVGTASNGSASVPAATPSTPAAALSTLATTIPSAVPSPSPTGPAAAGQPVDTGFGGVTAATAPALAPTSAEGDALAVPPATAAVQTAADAGEPEDTDAALDARIAALIKH